MSCFKFKQFIVEQEHSAMKVNTDGVLLGAWMEILPTDVFLLDVGTGCGVIALMAAQKVAQTRPENNRKCRIAALEIDEGSWNDAAGNFARAPWGKEPAFVLEAQLCSLQDFARECREKFDLIFSNPPYFINSLKSPETSRSNARHTDTLSQGEMIRCVCSLLAPGGRLALVLPVEETGRFQKKVEFLFNGARLGEYVLQIRRLCKVHTTESKPCKRCLLEFVFQEKTEGLFSAKMKKEEKLVIQCRTGYTDEYKELTREFYL